MLLLCSSFHDVINLFMTTSFYDNFHGYHHSGFNIPFVFVLKLKSQARTIFDKLRSWISFGIERCNGNKMNDS